MHHKLAFDQDPSSSDMAQSLLRELDVQRDWSGEQHPYWLVFEVEQQIQIRPQQHAVAEAMYTGRFEGTILQLNMGEGKSKCILPMLVLRLRYEQPSNIARVVYLPQLLTQNLMFIRESLTTSVLNHCFAYLPFSRQIDLAGAAPKQLLTQIQKWHQRHSVTVVQAPNDIQSLRLKLEEMKLPLHGGIEDYKECNLLRGKGNTHLEAFLALPFVNIFDESDEIFHHRRQLVYSIGIARPLSACHQRIIAVQALLSVIYRASTVELFQFENGSL
jgi:hypothetical protein